MKIQPRTIVAILAGIVALAWWSLSRTPVPSREAASTGDVAAPAAESSTPGAAQSSREPAPRPAPSSSAGPASPVDTATRARFNERTREFFARAPAMSAEDKQREAAEIEQELARMEQAGGLSAGETFLLRAGLIRETVQDQAQQVAQIGALKQRYQAEAQRRIAAAATNPDPVFESYKIRESQIVAEVAAMQTIPDGLSREEYLRRRLQAAREQVMSGTTH